MHLTKIPGFVFNWVQSFSSSHSFFRFLFYSVFYRDIRDPREFVYVLGYKYWKIRCSWCVATFQQLFWKLVADRGTFSRGSKSWRRGWLLLIKTWPRLGQLAWQCVWNIYVRVCMQEGIVVAYRCGRGYKRSMLHITSSWYHSSNLHFFGKSCLCDIFL